MYRYRSFRKEELTQEVMDPNLRAFRQARAQYYLKSIERKRCEEIKEEVAQQKAWIREWLREVKLRSVSRRLEKERAAVRCSKKIKRTAQEVISFDTFTKVSPNVNQVIELMFNDTDEVVKKLFSASSVKNKNKNQKKEKRSVLGHCDDVKMRKKRITDYFSRRLNCKKMLFMKKASGRTMNEGLAEKLSYVIEVLRGQRLGEIEKRYNAFFFLPTSAQMVPAMGEFRKECEKEDCPVDEEQENREKRTETPEFEFDDQYCTIDHEMESLSVDDDSATPMAAANTQINVGEIQTAVAETTGEMDSRITYDMKDYLSRWNHIGSFQWKSSASTDSDAIFNYDIFKSLMQSLDTTTAMIPFRNCQFYRADVEMLFTINTNQFTSGQLQLSILYGTNKCETSNHCFYSIYSLSQKPHVLLNAGGEQEALLRIPFKYPFSLVKNSPLASFGAANMAKVVVKVMSPLRMRGTQAFSAEVFVSARLLNVELSGMIDTNLRPQNDTDVDHEMLPIALNVASKLLAPTNMDQPPQQPSRISVQPIASNNMSSGTGVKVNAEILRLDPNSITPHDYEIDDFNFRKILDTYGLIGTFPIRSTQNSGTLLKKIEVTPLLSKTSYPKVELPSSTSKDFEVFALPPIAIATSMYGYYRGSLEYRFDVICTQFHACKILVAFVPGPVKKNATEWTITQLRNCHHQVYDILKEKTFSFTVPYISDQIFYPRRSIGSVGLSTFEPYGHMYVSILSNLYTSDMISSVIDVMVYLRAGPDFELAIPAQTMLQPSYDRSDSHKARYLSIEFLKGYYPAYQGTWHLFATSSAYFPILRYGNVSDHVCQVTHAHKYAVYRLDFGQNDIIPEWKMVASEASEKNNEILKPITYVSPIFDGSYFYVIPFVSKSDCTEFARYCAVYKAWGSMDKYILAYKSTRGTPSYASSSTQSTPYDASLGNLSFNFIVAFNPSKVEHQIGTETGLATIPTNMVTTVNAMSMKHFGETTMNLKDMCRRMQLYCSINISSNMPFLTSSAIIPITPWGISLDNISEDIMPTRSYLALIASGYLFMKGTLRFKIIAENNCKFWVQHRYDSFNIDEQSTIISDPNTQNIGMATGYAIAIQDSNVNPVLDVEIPYYSPCNRIYCNPTAGGLNPSQYLKQMFNLGSLIIGCSAPSKFTVFYSLGDDASFTDFIGFPPVMFAVDSMNSEPVTLNDSFEILNIDHEMESSEETKTTGTVKEKKSFLGVSFKQKKNTVEEAKKSDVSTPGPSSTSEKVEQKKETSNISILHPGAAIKKANKALDEVREVVQQVSEVTKGFDPKKSMEKFDTTMENLSGAAEKIGEFTDTASETLVPKVSKLCDTLTGFLDKLNVGSKLKKFFSKTKMFFINLISNILHCCISRTFKHIMVALGAILTSLTGFASHVVSGMVDLIRRMLNCIRNKYPLPKDSNDASKTSEAKPKTQPLWGKKNITVESLMIIRGHTGEYTADNKLKQASVEARMPKEEVEEKNSQIYNRLTKSLLYGRTCACITYNILKDLIIAIVKNKNMEKDLEVLEKEKNDNMMRRMFLVSLCDSSYKLLMGTIPIFSRIRVYNDMHAYSTTGMDVPFYDMDKACKEMKVSSMCRDYNYDDMLYHVINLDYCGDKKTKQYFYDKIPTMLSHLNKYVSPRCPNEYVVSPSEIVCLYEGGSKIYQKYRDNPDEEIVKIFKKYDVLLTSGKDYGLDHESDEKPEVSLVLELINLVLTSASAIADVSVNVHDKTKKNIASHLIRKLPLYARGSINMVSFLKSIWSLISKVFILVKAKMFPQSKITSDLVKRYPDVEEWLEECDLLLHPDCWDKIKTKPAYQARVDSALAHGNNLFSLIKMNEKYSNEHAFNYVIDTYYRNIVALKKKCHENKIKPAACYEPFMIYMWGNAGLGKSHLKDSLVKTMIDTCKIKTDGEYIFNVPLNSAYWTGCANQPVCYVDDFNLTTDEGIALKLYTDLVSIKSATSFCPNMAAVEDKGRPYNPQILYICSNFEKPAISGIGRVEAFLRRPEAYVQVRMRPDLVRNGKTRYELLSKQEKGAPGMYEYLQFGFPDRKGTLDENTNFVYTWYDFVNFRHILLSRLLTYRIKESIRMEERLKVMLNCSDEEEMLIRAKKFINPKLEKLQGTSIKKIIEIESLEEVDPEIAPVESAVNVVTSIGECVGMGEIVPKESDVKVVIQEIVAQDSLLGNKEAHNVKSEALPGPSGIKKKKEEEEISPPPVYTYDENFVPRPLEIEHIDGMIDNVTKIVADVVVKPRHSEKVTVPEPQNVEELLNVEHESKVDVLDIHALTSSKGFVADEISQSNLIGLIDEVAKQEDNSPHRIRLLKHVDTDYVYFVRDLDGLQADVFRIKNSPLDKPFLPQWTKLYVWNISKIKSLYTDSTSVPHIFRHKYLQDEKKYSRLRIQFIDYIDSVKTGLSKAWDLVAKGFRHAYNFIMKYKWIFLVLTVALSSIGLGAAVIKGYGMPALVGLQTAQTFSPAAMHMATHSSNVKQYFKEVDSSRAAPCVEYSFRPETVMGSYDPGRKLATKKLNKNFKKSYNFYNHEISDSISPDIISRIQNNTFWLTIRDKDDVIRQSMRVFCTGGRSIVFPLHYAECVRRYKSDDYTLHIEKDNMNIKLRKSLFDDPPLVGKTSLRTTTLPVQFPARRSCQHMMFNGEPGNLPPNSGFLIVPAPDKVVLFNSPYSISSCRVPSTEKGSSILIIDGYRYNAHGSGFCGSLFVVNNRICGMHVAGGSGVGFSESMCEYIYNHEIVDSDFPEKFIDPDGEPTPYEGNCEILGVVDKKWAAYTPGETSYVMSPIAEHLQVDAHPAPLAPFEVEGEMVSPLHSGVEKHMQPNTDFPTHVLDMATINYKSMLLSKCKPVRTKVGVLSMEEAAYGLSENDRYPPMDRTTSVGWPYIRMGAALNNKNSLIGFPESGMNEEFKKYAEKMESMRKRLIRTPTVFQDSLKDDLVPERKIGVPGGTRVISCCPIEFLLTCRRYLGDFTAAMSSANFFTESAVGMNVLGHDWNRLAHHMGAFADTVLDGDYKNFGPTLNSKVLGKCSDIILEWYRVNGSGNQEDQNVRKVLLDELINSVHLAGRTLYKTVSGAPSGSPITVVLNGMVNSIYIRCVWRMIFKDMNHFNENVRIITYGDDILIAVKNAAKDIFTFAKIQKIFSDHGIVFTPANKQDAEKIETKLEDVTFLKSRFIFNKQYNAYFYALDIASITKMLKWVKKSKYSTIMDTFKTNLRACGVYLIGHGSEVYNSYLGKLEDTLSASTGLTMFYDAYDVALHDLHQEVFDDACRQSPITLA